MKNNKDITIGIKTEYDDSGIKSAQAGMTALKVSINESSATFEEGAAATVADFDAIGKSATLAAGDVTKSSAAASASVEASSAAASASVVAGASRSSKALGGIASAFKMGTAAARVFTNVVGRAFLWLGLIDQCVELMKRLWSWFNKSDGDAQKKRKKEMEEQVILQTKIKKLLEASNLEGKKMEWAQQRIDINKQYTEGLERQQALQSKITTEANRQLQLDTLKSGNALDFEERALQLKLLMGEISELEYGIEAPKIKHKREDAAHSQQVKVEELAQKTAEEEAEKQADEAAKYKGKLTNWIEPKGEIKNMTDYKINKMKIQEYDAQLKVDQDEEDAKNKEKYPDGKYIPPKDREPVKMSKDRKKEYDKLRKKELGYTDYLWDNNHKVDEGASVDEAAAATASIAADKKDMEARKSAAEEAAKAARVEADAAAERLVTLGEIAKVTKNKQLDEMEDVTKVAEHQVKKNKEVAAQEAQGVKEQAKLKRAEDKLRQKSEKTLKQKEIFSGTPSKKVPKEVREAGSRMLDKAAESDKSEMMGNLQKWLKGKGKLTEREEEAYGDDYELVRSGASKPMRRGMVAVADKSLDEYAAQEALEKEQDAAKKRTESKKKKETAKQNDINDRDADTVRDTRTNVDDAQQEADKAWIKEVSPAERKPRTERERPAPVAPRVDAMAEARASAKAGIDSNTGAAEIAAVSAASSAAIQASSQAVTSECGKLSTAIASAMDGGMQGLLATIVAALEQVNSKAEATSNRAKKLEQQVRNLARK